MMLPKLLTKHASKIRSYEKDPEDGSHWVDYAAGWKSASDPMGVVHGDTEVSLRELSKCVAAAVSCNCAECVRG